MAPLLLLTLAGASVLSLNCQAVPGEITDSRGHRAVVTSCVAEVNEARVAAGLSPCTEQEFSLKEDHVEDLEGLCALLKDDLDGTELEHVEDSNIMVAPQEGPDVNCRAAVEYWKSAGEAMGQTPPPNSAENSVYTSFKSLGFSSLYSAQRNPVLRCIHITCRTAGLVDEMTTSGSTAIEGHQHSALRVRGGDTNTRRLSGDSSSEAAVEKHRLVCISAPSGAAQSSASIEAKTWENNTRAMRKSAASPVSFGFSAFFAAMFAIVIFV